MITVTSYKFKYFSQKSYDEFIENINFNQLTCVCSIKGQLIRHASYKRSIKTPDGLITLKILRVKCKSCGKTHAIFPKSIVPYSRISLFDHVSIILTHISGKSFEPIMMENENIEEGNIRYVIKQYLRYWKERITSFGLSITNDIGLLATRCISIFKRQFMQIKCTPNVLFS